MLFCTLNASQAELRVLKMVLAIILCSIVVDALNYHSQEEASVSREKRMHQGVLKQE